ncbi:cilia- and flagella-associated protein 100-like [Erpetoichthys calabaricus]|uniref:cilia- and flagella-associated protein 100-like n=1 Tax=Erpetoichthys calabaricus TaxID=27687 RepID=UPI002234D8A6|nr:cilia- and flagella-associated protein 100-like [Erpetoichthys calabaricus]
MPLDQKIMQYREEQAKQEQKEMMFYKSLPAELKSTFLSRLRAHAAPYRKPLECSMCEEETAQDQLINTKGFQYKNMSIREYLHCQRESYHLRHLVYGINAEMKRMEDISLKEKKNLSLVEKHLENEDNTFEKLLQATLETFVESVNIAKHETELKLEKTAEIRRVMAEMAAIGETIMKNKETLNTYLQYKLFLLNASPPAWKKEQERKEMLRKEAKQQYTGKQNGENVSLAESAPTALQAEMSVPNKTVNILLPELMSPKENVSCTREITDHFIEESDFLDYDEEPELYFTDPKQLLNILLELEDDIISYIHNNQEDKAWKLKILQLRHKRV